MAKALSADELLAGATTTRRVPIPSGLLHGRSDANEAGATAGEVTLRPLTVRDIQRVNQASKENRVLASVLMVHQALVSPELTVEQVSSLPAGLVQFLLCETNAISGLALDDDDLDGAVKAPMARACFVLSREFGWSPAECSDLTVGQVLLYLEMLARGERPGEETP